MTSASQVTDDDLALQAEFDTLEKAVEQVRQAPDLTAKRKLEKEARRVLGKVKSTARSFRNSVQRLDDPTQRSVYNRKYSSYDERLTNFDKELRNLVTAPKNPGSRGAAAAASSGGDRDKKVTFEEKRMEEIMGEGGKEGMGFENATQVMQAANRAQDDANKSLLRSLRLGVTMRDQSHEIMEVLSKQTEKLYQIDKELDVLDTDVQRAKKDVMWFFRQMAGDKCCLAFLIFLLLGIIGLIFWKIYSKRIGDAGGDGGTTSTTADPSSTIAAPPSLVTTTTKAPCNILELWKC